MTLSISKFIKEDVWTVSEANLTLVQLVGLKVIKVFLLSVQGFKRDLCQLRASALTLYTLLSIVPVIALLFGIAKGFGFEKKLEQQLIEQSSEQDTMIIQLIEFSQNMLSSTKGGVVAGIGIVVLFWTVIKVIGNIEESFNHIWKIEKNRSVARKLSDYLSLMMLAPVLLIMSSSITVFVKTQITWLVAVIRLPEFATHIVVYAMSYSPMVIMSGLFIFIFLFMPNKKISIKAGIIAGVITGVLFQIVQSAYLALQLGASSYNAIYGSFAALPLFLIWLQIVWVVVLFGCEISFYVQNYESYRHNEKFSNLSYFLKKNIAIQVCHSIVIRFASSDKAPTAEWIADKLQLPLSIIDRSLSELIESNIVVELKSGDENVCYQPAYDINKLTISSVSHALEVSGRNNIPGEMQQDHISKLSSIDENSLLKDLQYTQV